MTTQRTRTPRRRKAWMEYHSLLALNEPESHVDLLSPSLIERGLTDATGLTVMRIFGSVTGVLWTASATTPALSSVRFGITWVPEAVADLAAGAAGVPEPLQHGDHQSQWICQGKVYVEETGSTPVVGKPSPLDSGHSTMLIDSTQMRKQPNMDSNLVFIQKNSGFEDDTVRLDIDLSILVALP